MKELLTKQNFVEGFFILICILTSSIIGNYSSIVTGVLLLIVYFSRNYIRGKETIYSNRKLIMPFISVYSILVINAILTTSSVYKNLGINPGQIKIILKIVCVILLLTLIKFLNIKMSQFNWKINKKQIYITILIRHFQKNYKIELGIGCWYSI
jgi:uncharacterized membrane protein